MRKTLYISFRPTMSLHIVQPLYNSLRELDYDVYIDLDDVVDPVSLRQIAAREHFIMILTPGALRMANHPDDRLVQDLHTATQHQRNMLALVTRDTNYDSEFSHTGGLMDGLADVEALRITSSHLPAVVNVLQGEFFRRRAQGATVPTPPADAAQVEAKLLTAKEYALQSTIKLQSEGTLFKAVAKIREGRYNEALNELDSVIAQSPSNESAYFHRAGLLRMMGRKTAAMRDYEKATQLSPKMTEAHIGRGELLLGSARYLQALESFKMAQRVQKDSAPAIAGAALANHGLGNTTEATRLWQILLARDPHYRRLDWVVKTFDWDNDIAKLLRNLLNKLP